MIMKRVIINKKKNVGDADDDRVINAISSQHP